MSALAAPTPLVAADERRPGFARLTTIELRKMVDTRSGFWLPIGVALITLITVVISALVHGSREATISHLFSNATMPGSFLLPILGVLLVCGEFTQRTTLTTFTLVPNRGRVLAAKLAASMVFAFAAFVLCLVFGVIFAELLSAAPGGAGGLSVKLLGQGLVFLMLSMGIGIAFGAAILVSAPAIVTYLLLPTIWGALTGAISALKTLGNWLSIGTTLGNLPEHGYSGSDWAKVATTVALWLVVPLALGWWRFRTRDVG